MTSSTDLHRQMAAAANIARTLDWSAQLSLGKDGLAIACPDRPLPSLCLISADAGKPVWSGYGNRKSGSFRLAGVPDIIICEALAALGISHGEALVFDAVADGHAAAGPIDAIAPRKSNSRLEDASSCCGKTWTYETVAAQHSRATVVRLSVEDAAAPEEIIERLRQNPLLVALPAWADVSDTAVACEYLRDLDGVCSPRAIVFGYRFDDRPDGVGRRHIFWLAAGAGLLRVVLADAIGAVSAPDMESRTRRDRIIECLDSKASAQPFRGEPSGSRIRVGIVSAGTIGKRVAEAVGRQDDMMLAGIAAKALNASLHLFSNKGVALYSLDGSPSFAGSDQPPAGGLDALLSQCDIIVDCGPRGTAASRASLYATAGVPAVYQGGEDPDLAEAQFNATVAFDQASGRASARVGSCNTTGLARIIDALKRAAKLADVRVCLVRSASDTDKASKGSPNAVILHLGKSHHAADLKSFFPGLPITTVALHVPTNHAHLMQLFVTCEEAASPSAVLETLAQSPRIILLEGDAGSTGDLRRLAGSGPRRDTYAVAVWTASLVVRGNEIALAAAVHMEAIVIPETIDAIRALLGKARSAAASRLATDTALEVRSGHVRMVTGGVRC